MDEIELFTDFQFGKTTLREIRERLGTNGFMYKNRGLFTADNDLVGFNCFEFDSPNNEILILITTAAITPDLTEDNVVDKLKLDAVIIAHKSYCDREWGTYKTYSENFKKIKP